MKKRKENEKNFIEISTSTSTELQKDIGDIDCYSKNNNCNEADLANYLLMQQNERLNKIDEILKEINAPLIDKINKYKWVFSIVVTIIVAVIGAFFTIHSFM